MKAIWIILKEQIQYFPIIFRLATYETRAKYKDHSLGIAWDIINPVMQIATYWLVFGIALKRGGTVGGVPYLPWLVVGQAAWLFLNTSFMDATWSIRNNVRQVAKMNFPISIMPTIRTWINVLPFMITLTVGVVISMGNGVHLTFYVVQLLYYFIAMLVFLQAVGIFNATITVLYPDYQQLIQTVMRFVFWLSGAVFDIASQVGQDHVKVSRLLEMNPFYYLIAGVRDSIFSTHWFFEKPWQMLDFWALILFIWLIGAHVHLKFRAYFTDLI